jgi:predicted Rossmann fold flavoprotein
VIYDFIIIGGGAAGFFAAAAFAADRPRSRVLVLEKGSALLAKVSISGGGRCNLTNACFDPAQLVQFYPRGSAALRGAFSRFQPMNTIEWFEERGVATKTETDGRVFPASDSSETVVQCLLSESARLGVDVRMRAPVVQVRALSPGGFELELRDGSLVQGKTVLLASGGERGGIQMAAELGHRILPPVPSLFTFKLTDTRLDGLAGLSVVDVKARIPDLRLEQRGPVLITHWGLSGPVILRLSAFAARGLFDCTYQTTLEINWLPGLRLEEMEKQLAAYKAANGRKMVQAKEPSGKIPQRLWRSLSSAAGIAEDLVWASVSRQQMQGLVETLGRGKFSIVGKGEFKEEFVTCGGVALDEVDFRQMQSKKIPGLFFAGEVLDIDGVTGGFNLQSAWTTGWIAGHSAAEYLAAQQFDLSGPQS